jgi:hypothetical protein
LRPLSGEVAEWSKALDWNSSNVQKAFVGSNPTLSAKFVRRPGAGRRTQSAAAGQKIRTMIGRRTGLDEVLITISPRIDRPVTNVFGAAAWIVQVTS